MYALPLRRSRICVGLDVTSDESQIHPQSFCKRCHDAIRCKLKAVSELRPFNSLMQHGALQVGAHPSHGVCKLRQGCRDISRYAIYLICDIFFSHIAIQTCMGYTETEE